MSKSRETFAVMLEEQRRKTPKDDKHTLADVLRQADDLIVIRQLKGIGRSDEHGDDDDDAADMSRALATNKKADSNASRLNRVYQLTGFADPVYAEAHLTVQEYDIVLDIMIVNQTPSTIQVVVTATSFRSL